MLEKLQTIIDNTNLKLTELKKIPGPSISVVCAISSCHSILQMTTAMKASIELEDDYLLDRQVEKSQSF
jgi:hypothetical protein